jgi:hypothetical protein
MLSPCDNCKNRQKSRDPYGCFHQHGITDKFGRFMKIVFGCEYYRRLNDDNNNE